MAREYIHELGHEVRAISGGYTLEEEGVLEMGGKEVLYVVGHGVVDSSCCGVGGCRFAVVPGYVIKLKTRQNENSSWVSEVEPVMDGPERVEIKHLLEKKEIVQQVQFL